MSTLGAIVLPQLPPERLLDAARAADEAGLDELWLWEDCFWTSGLSAAAAILGATTRVRVGVGLLPVPLRNVALTAMEIATLERMFPGRAIIGVGHGVQSWMGQVGERVASPLTLLREYTTALRALLRGDRLTVTGRYVKLDDVALDWAPVDTRVHVGASGPKTLRLAGEVGEGTLLTAATTPAELTTCKALVDEGHAGAGRTGALPVVVNLLAATGPDALDRVTRELHRFGDTPDGPVADLAVAGDAHEVAAGARRWFDAGATTVLLQPALDEPDPVGFLRFAAQEVAPLLR